MARSRFEQERERLGHQVRSRRIELGMTQEDAAHAMMLSTRHYQKLESGELNVTLRTLVKVATALRFELYDLFAR